MHRLIQLTVALIISTVSAELMASDFVGAWRSRPPAMMLENNTPSGPVKDIIELAMADHNFSISWTPQTFKRSIEDAKQGVRIDVIPRLFMSAKRREFLLPMVFGYEDKSIRFAVSKGKKDSINRYEDLHSLKIGEKRGTFYFEQFNDDTQLKKFAVTDDKNLVGMLKGKRIDAAVILDPGAFEAMAEKLNFTDYEYANYQFKQVKAWYYAIPKKSDKSVYHKELNCSLYKMRKSGAISTIYSNYGLAPLIQDWEHPSSKAQQALCEG